MFRHRLSWLHCTHLISRHPICSLICQCSHRGPHRGLGGIWGRRHRRERPPTPAPQREAGRASTWSPPITSTARVTSRPPSTTTQIQRRGDRSNNSPLTSGEQTPPKTATTIATAAGVVDDPRRNIYPPTSGTGADNLPEPDVSAPARPSSSGGNYSPPICNDRVPHKYRHTVDS